MSKDKAKHKLDIDQYGKVTRKGKEIELKTPNVRLPFGIDNFKGKWRLQMKFVESEDDNKEAYDFIQQVRVVEKDIDAQIDGKFNSSITESEQWNTKFRANIDAVKGQVTAELYRKGKLVMPEEVARGSTAIFSVKLDRVWNFDGKSGGTWVVTKGDICPPGGKAAKSDKKSKKKISSENVDSDFDMDIKPEDSDSDEEEKPKAKKAVKGKKKSERASSDSESDSDYEKKSKAKSKRVRSL
jgi:hypothetical protein